jgi:protein dpy-30
MSGDGKAGGPSEPVSAEGAAAQTGFTPPAPAFPTADAAKKVEETAKKAKVEASAKAMPSRQYLESSVVPILMQGMQELAKERPEDPVQYLAAYLIKHNPKKSV